MEGYIKLIIGPMFSGKTSLLCEEVDRFTFTDKKCLIIRPSIDMRFVEESNTIHTHGGKFRYNEKLIDVHITMDLRSVDIEKYDVIGIDEGQFFINICSITKEWASKFNKIVIIAALSGNYLFEPFPEISLLLSEADEIIHKLAICQKCKKRNSAFTEKIPFEINVGIIDIGSKDKYIAVCRICRKI